MNAPLIWIGIPLAAGLVLLFFNYRRQVTARVAAGLCTLLALAAGLLNIDAPTLLGSLAVEISSTFSILGRRLVIEDADRGFLVLCFILGAVWFLGLLTANANRLFAPLGLVMIALLIAARSVEPFLYAALLVEMAVLISLPMMAPPGSLVGRGLMRYLVFQTLAMPFILLAGWVIRTIEINPTNEALYLQAALLLGLGFAIWLAVFPFYTWVPMLTDEVPAYVSGFTLSLLTTVVLFYSLDFLNEYAWLRTARLLPQVLQVTGAMMVATGGIWTAFQPKLSRALGYAFILQTGISLLAVSLQSEAGLSVFAASLLPRLLAIWLWALVISILVRRGITPTLTGVRGLFRLSPLPAVGLGAAWLSLAGLPLLGIYPVRQVLIEGLAQKSLSLAFWVILGNVGLLFSALRVISSMVQPPAESEPLTLTWQEVLLLLLAVLVLILIGVFPNMFLSGMLSLVESFKNLP